MPKASRDYTEPWDWKMSDSVEEADEADRCSEAGDWFFHCFHEITNTQEFLICCKCEYVEPFGGWDK